jgi:hypothetical protein
MNMTLYACLFLMDCLLKRSQCYPTLQYDFIKEVTYGKTSNVRRSLLSKTE